MGGIECKSGDILGMTGGVNEGEKKNRLTIRQRISV
jgi:hypothetical protein